MTFAGNPKTRNIHACNVQLLPTIILQIFLLLHVIRTRRDTFVFSFRSWCVSVFASSSCSGLKSENSSDCKVKSKNRLRRSKQNDTNSQSWRSAHSQNRFRKTTNKVRSSRIWSVWRLYFAFSRMPSLLTTWWRPTSPFPESWHSCRRPHPRFLLSTTTDSRTYDHAKIMVRLILVTYTFHFELFFPIFYDNS